MTFKVGDQVQLKSGGPIMTVVTANVGAAPERSLSFNCAWFDKDHVQHTGTFPRDALHLYKEEKAPEPREDNG